MIWSARTKRKISRNTEHSLVNKEKRTFLVQYCDDFYLLSSVNFFHFLCRSLCPRLPDFCLSPSSRLSTTMHHCTVLDKCNLCDNILSNDTNLKKHRMKYHKGDPFKQCLLCPRLCHVMSFVCQETNPHCSFPAMQCRNVKIFPCRALHCNWMDDAMKS